MKKFLWLTCCIASLATAAQQPPPPPADCVNAIATMNNLINSAQGIVNNLFTTQQNLITIYGKLEAENKKNGCTCVKQNKKITTKAKGATKATTKTVSIAACGSCKALQNAYGQAAVEESNALAFIAQNMGGTPPPPLVTKKNNGLSLTTQPAWTEDSFGQVTQSLTTLVQGVAQQAANLQQVCNSPESLNALNGILATSNQQLGLIQQASDNLIGQITSLGGLGFMALFYLKDLANTVKSIAKQSKQLKAVIQLNSTLAEQAAKSAGKLGMSAQQTAKLMQETANLIRANKTTYSGVFTDAKAVSSLVKSAAKQASQQLGKGADGALIQAKTLKNLDAIVDEAKLVQKGVKTADQVSDGAKAFIKAARIVKATVGVAA